MSDDNHTGQNDTDANFLSPWTAVAVALVVGAVVGGYQILNRTAPDVVPSEISVADDSNDEERLGREVAELRRQLEQEKLKTELAETRRELAALQADSLSRRPQPVATPRRRETERRETVSIPRAETRSRAESPKQTRGRRTLEYWNQMNGIFEQEASMRAVPSGGLTAQNAGDFLQRRASAGEFAAQSLRDLDQKNVDVEVVKLAKKIAVWYEKGVKNNNVAGGLLGANRETRQGSKGKQWKSAEKRHNRAVNDINRKGEQVRAKMSKKYGLTFPPMK